MPKISVIMSAYNCGDQEALKMCIDSIKQQSYPHFEMIICDDGSTDRTLTILQDLCGEDERFVIIRNENNRGAASARNKCLRLASGEYIAIMDADDSCAATRLEKQMNFLDQNPMFDYVGTAAQLFDENGIWEKRAYKTRPAKRDFLFVLPFVHASVMFRKSALQAVQGYCEDRMVLRCEDYDLFMRLYAAESYGANLKQELYFVREDKEAFRRRKYRYRWNELAVRYKGFRKLGMLPAGYPYVIKPLIVGLIPHKLLLFLKRKYYKK